MRDHQADLAMLRQSLADLARDEEFHSVRREERDSGEAGPTCQSCGVVVERLEYELCEFCHLEILGVPFEPQSQRECGDCDD